MPGELPAPLQDLEKKTFNELLVWLESALRGCEALPKIVPDETADAPILRAERALSKMTRGDLREACRTLVRRFTKDEAAQDTAYVQALLHLAVGLGLTDAPATDLQLLVADAARFGQLPRAQQKSVLFALLDLRVILPVEFWQEVASRDEGRLAVTAFAGLIRENASLAVSLLPLMRDRPKAADALYVVLRQEGAKLSADQRDAFATGVRGIARECGPEIQAALNDWLGEQRPAPEAAPDPLDAALMKWVGNAYQRRPQPASLLAA